MPELRQDPLSGRWVVIATGRAKRPEAFVCTDRSDPLPEHDPTCCFCPGNEQETPPEVFALRRSAAADSPGWTLRVVPNKFAAFDLAEGWAPGADVVLERRAPAYGAAEVLIETARHDRPLSTASDAEIAMVCRVAQARYAALAAMPGVGYVILFRNQGTLAGASQIHPHSQLIAAPVVPEAVRTELDRAASYFGAHGRCLLCDMLLRERDFGERIVYDGDGFVVLAPFASRAPFELMILPSGHQADFASLAPERLLGLATALGQAMRRLDRALGDPPYNLYLHALPPHEREAEASYHWHLSVLPRVTTPAAFELGTEIRINITLPEAAAAFLRNA